MLLVFLIGITPLLDYGWKLFANKVTHLPNGLSH